MLKMFKNSIFYGILEWIKEEKMMDFILGLVFIFFVVSLFGYILVVLREKQYLKNNMIVIDNKYVTEEHLEQTDLKEFYLDGRRIKSGDEIKVVSREKKSVIGTLIGAIVEEQSIMLITKKNKILKLKIEDIMEFKVISKYGKFLS